MFYLFIHLFLIIAICKNMPVVSLIEDLTRAGHFI